MEQNIRKDRQTNVWMDGELDELVDGDRQKKKKQTGGQTESGFADREKVQTEGWADRGDGQTEGWTDRGMDRQWDGQTEGWTDRGDGQTEGMDRQRYG